MHYLVIRDGDPTEPDIHVVKSGQSATGRVLARARGDGPHQMVVLFRATGDFDVVRARCQAFVRRNRWRLPELVAEAKKAQPEVTLPGMDLAARVFPETIIRVGD